MGFRTRREQYVDVVVRTYSTVQGWGCGHVQYSTGMGFRTRREPRTVQYRDEVVDTYGTVQGWGFGHVESSTLM